MTTSKDAAAPSSSFFGRNAGSASAPRRFNRAIVLVAAVWGAILAAILLFPLATLDPAPPASQKRRSYLSFSDPTSIHVKEPPHVDIHVAERLRHHLQLLFCDDGGGEPTTTFFADGYPEPEEPLKGCFVSSIFGMSPKASDRPVNVAGPRGHDLRRRYPRYEFLMFTNMIDLETPGWRKVMHFDKSKRRMITQSRWPKFLAWREKWVRKYCPVVFYIDGNMTPLERESVFDKQGAAILKSEVGFAQPFNGKSVEIEFKKILQKKKDTKANVETTRAWMKSQPDYAKWTRPRRVYSNSHIAYDPNSPTFQHASSYFWDVYSGEELMWRDQPLWAYALHHLGLIPIIPTSEKRYRFNIKKHTGSGGGKHVYDGSADDEADRYLAMVRETGMCDGFPPEGATTNSTLGAL